MNARSPTYHELEETMRGMAEKMGKPIIEYGYHLDTLQIEIMMLRS